MGGKRGWPKTLWSGAEDSGVLLSKRWSRHVTAMGANWLDSYVSGEVRGMVGKSKLSLNLNPRISACLAVCPWAC